MQLTIKTETTEGVYGMIWGTRAFMLAEKRLNKNLIDIMFDIAEDETILTLAYCALQNWHESKDESNVLPFSFGQFCNWLDEQPKEIGDQIAASYMESSYQGKTMQTRYDEVSALLAEAESKEGKVVKKKSTPSVKS